MRPDDQEHTRGHADPGRLLTDYRRVRQFSEQLCEPLAIEDYLLQTVVELPFEQTAAREAGRGRSRSLVDPGQPG